MIATESMTSPHGPGVLFQMGPGRKVQMFDWAAGDGSRKFQWNVEAAIRASIGLQRNIVRLDTLAFFASMNGGLADRIHMPTLRRIIIEDDFDRPLIFVIRPDQPDDQNGILIDGWHRLCAALVVQRDLTGVLLPREIECAIRVEDVIYL